MSLTIASLFLLVLNEWVKSQGIDFGADKLQGWLQDTITILAPLGVLIGRVRAGGVSWLGLRTKK